MIRERIHVANIKCGGCETTVSKQLLKIDGVNEVHVNSEKGEVIVAYSTPEIHESVLATLKQLGYPEVGDNNSLLDRAKSYASCMIGRFSKDN